MFVSRGSDRVWLVTMDKLADELCAADLAVKQDTSEADAAKQQDEHAATTTTADVVTKEDDECTTADVETKENEPPTTSGGGADAKPVVDGVKSGGEIVVSSDDKLDVCDAANVLVR